LDERTFACHKRRWYKQINLTVAQVQLKGEGLLRAGAHALSLLATPLNAEILQALAGGPVALVDLRMAAGVPPPTTMRMHLRALSEAGIVERRQQREFPSPVEYELTRAGQDLVAVATALQDWLKASPQGPVELGSNVAKSSTKALADGWSSGIVRALASRPLALTELSRLISNLSYPSLERRLGAMRVTGLVERRSVNGRGRPYEISRWLRLASAPLAAAARWERKYLRDDTPPIRRLDIEAAFLLALPLVSLSEDRSGVCRLAVDTSQGSQHRQAGVLVRFQGGRMSNCVTRVEGSVDASAAGSASAWMGAVSRGSPSRLDLGGDRELARSLVEGIHRSLFGNRGQR
jgi:DNA-binding HxlR family transcriptional regulator